MTASKLMDTLTRIERETDGDTISLGDVVESLNNRGFGTLLIVPSLLVVLPTGAIPFLPAICAAFMTLVCAQMVIGRHHPWLPQTLKRVSIRRTQYERAIQSATPFIRKLDDITRPRLKILTRHVAQRIVAVLCIALSFGIALVAVFPFAADPLALAILCFAVGISTRDGLIMAIGFMVTVIAIGFLPTIIASSQDFMGPQFIAPLPANL